MAATPEPTVLRVLRGNPGKRPIDGREPQPRVKRPKCPEHLDEHARVEWKRLAPILTRMRVLTEADEIALAALCQEYSKMVKAEKMLEESGLIYENPVTGRIAQHPLVAIVQSSLVQIKALCCEFGLTPASRTRIHVNGEKRAESGGLLNGEWQSVG